MAISFITVLVLVRILLFVSHCLFSVCLFLLFVCCLCVCVSKSDVFIK